LPSLWSSKQGSVAASQRLLSKTVCQVPALSIRVQRRIFSLGAISPIPNPKIPGAFSWWPLEPQGQTTAAGRDWDTWAQPTSSKAKGHFRCVSGSDLRVWVHLAHSFDSEHQAHCHAVGRETLRNWDKSLGQFNSKRTVEGVDHSIRERNPEPGDSPIPDDLNPLLQQGPGHIPNQIQDRTHWLDGRFGTLG